MSQVKSHFKFIISLTMAALFALSCSRGGGGQTQFSKNMEADAGKPAPTYEEWVALVGQEKTDALYAGVGQDSLNILSYGIGISNMANLLNSVASSQALIDLIGNDFITGAAGEQGPGGKTGLGAIAILTLLKGVDAQAQAPNNVSINLPPVGAGYCGNQPVYPTSASCTIDVTAKLAAMVNMLQAATTLKTKLVAMFGPLGFNLQRNLSGANDAVIVARLARVVAQVDADVPSANCAAAGRVCSLLTNLTAADITGKLAPLISYNPGLGVAYASKLVETIQVISFGDISARMVPLLASPTGVTVGNITKLGQILENVTDCTKMGYVVNQIAPVANITGVLVPIINKVASPTRLATVINGIEDSATYTAISAAIATNNWAGASQTWGSPGKAQPYGTAGAGATLTINMLAGAISSVTIGGGGGSGYHSDVSISAASIAAYQAGCSSTAKINLGVTAGVITSATVANNGTSGCTIPNLTPLALTDVTTTTGMARLVSMLNTITSANYFQMLSLIDTVSDVRKLILLIQDGRDVTDLVQMLNAMTPVDTTGVPLTTCNGVITITGAGAGATATGFVTGVGPTGPLAHIAVTASGAGYSGTPTISDGGCGDITANVTTVISGGLITGIYINALPVNTMAELVENLSANTVTRTIDSNIVRLREVVDGQRIFNNDGTQQPAAASGTYLQKMVSLLSSLNQPSEGPIKVTQMLKGVTNTDKIIDLIYGVTATSNLASIINNIFSESMTVGCSNTTYLAQATCDQGATTVAGNGFVWGERNQAVKTMVYVLENVVNTQNLVGMINGTTPTQVSDLINHVSSSGESGPNTPYLGLNVVNREDLAVGGGPANTFALSGAGMRLVKVIDYSSNAAYPYDLAFLMNKTSTIKVAKLIIQMPIGQTVAGAIGSYQLGTGKIGNLLNQISGTNCWNQLNGVTSVTGLPSGTLYAAAPIITFTGCVGVACPVAVATVSGGVVTAIHITDPGTTNYAAPPTVNITPVSGGVGASATAVLGSCGETRGLQQTTGTQPLANIGKGKLVNMLSYITAATDTSAMNEMRNLINNINMPASNPGQKLGDLVNRVKKSSNLIALVNAVLDTNNNNGGSTSNLVSLMNQVPLAGIQKLIALINQMGNAIETPTDTLAGSDQNLVAQLMGNHTLVNTSLVGTLTFTAASTTVNWAAHGLAVNDSVVFTTAGTLPAGLTPGLAYFVTSTALNTFTIGTTQGATSSITFPDAGVGAHSGWAYGPSQTSGVGSGAMVNLLGMLDAYYLVNNAGTTTHVNGKNLTSASFGGVSLDGGSGTGAAATPVIASGQVMRVNLATAGECDTASLPSVSLSGGGFSAPATIQPIWMPKDGSTTRSSLVAVVVTDGGTGYTSAPTVALGACTGTAPTFGVPNTEIDGILAIDVTNVGTGYATNFNPTMTVVGTAPLAAAMSAVAAGGLAVASFTNPFGGTGYTNGQTCPILGAGGSGATVVVNVAAGAVTFPIASITTAGTDYRSGQVVTIGGTARAHAVVDAAGNIAAGTTSLITNFSGCGYTAPPTLRVEGCTIVNPTATAALNGTGGVGTLTVTVPGSGCPRNPRVIIGASPASNATAVVGAVTSGYLADVTVVPAAHNMASVLVNANKVPLYAATTYIGSAPNISIREAMVRLLHTGVGYPGGLVAFGKTPGLGPVHLAELMNNSNAGGSTQMSVINLLNSPTTGLDQLGFVLGCADKVLYAHTAPLYNNDWEDACLAIYGTW